MYVQALGSPCQLCPRVYLFDFVAVPGTSADTSRDFAPNETLAMAHGRAVFTNPLSLTTCALMQLN